MQWMGSRIARLLSKSWAFQFAVMALAFALLHRQFRTLMHLKDEVYLDPFILDGVFTSKRAVAAALTCAVFLIVIDRRVRWKTLGARWIKPVTLGCAAALAWSICTFGYNYFTNEFYLIDRLAIVVLLALSFWRPAFLLPLLIALMLFASQQRVSAGDLETTDKFPLLDLQIAFIAWLTLRTVLPMRARTLLWFLAALQAINYIAPGIAKLTVGGSFEPLVWVSENPMYALVATAAEHGWFYWMEPASVETVVGTSAFLTPLLAVMALSTELGIGVLILTRRGGAFALLGAIALHVGIFALTGILFWKWIFLDGLLIYALLASRTPQARSIRRPVAMAALIACFPLFAAPKRLGWLDTHVSEHYLIEVVTADGNVRIVDQADMSPFDLTVEQGIFHYANTEPMLVADWGSVRDVSLARTINAADNEAALRKIVAAHGKVHFSEQKAAELDAFLRTYFGHVNERNGSMRWLKWIGPPVHVLVRSGQPRFDFEEKVVAARLRFRRTLLVGHRHVTVDDYIVREVPISRE